MHVQALPQSPSSSPVFLARAVFLLSFICFFHCVMRAHRTHRSFSSYYCCTLCCCCCCCTLTRSLLPLKFLIRTRATSRALLLLLLQRGPKALQESESEKEFVRARGPVLLKAERRLYSRNSLLFFCSRDSDDSFLLYYIILEKNTLCYTVKESAFLMRN